MNTNFSRLEAALAIQPKLAHLGPITTGSVINPATNITVPTNKWNAWSVASKTNPDR